MAKKWYFNIKFLEHGDIYFFYKPRKGVTEVENIKDVSRFFIVMQPFSDSPQRYIVMGNKKMPQAPDGGETSWGFLQMVGGRGFKTFSDQDVSNYKSKNASRPAGEGAYAIVSHRDHSHLLYSLEFPKVPGEVQNAFNIKKEANYIFLNRPVQVSPRSIDTPFSNFSKVNVENLNERGTEILLIGVGADIGRLGISVEKSEEMLHSADIFANLKMDATRHPIRPLISGKWV